MPDVSQYYVATGYVEPGYFVSEPAPPELIKKETITVYKEIDGLVLYIEKDDATIYRTLDEVLVFRPLNRTTAYVSVIEV